jgi:hypothetical protein
MRLNTLGSGTPQRSPTSATGTGPMKALQERYPARLRTTGREHLIERL